MNEHANIGLIEQISAQLTDLLGEDFDADTFWDTLDGETDVMDIFGILIREREEATAYAAASKALADDFTARQRRLAARASAIAQSMGAVLDAAGQRKVSHPLATISRTQGRLSVAITNEADIPSQLCKVVSSPDKTAIKKQLEAGESVPGAELVRGKDGVTVRVK